ncbi:MAG: Rpn family recombination-promoting nuclease/putative transposase [Clostridiales Family XIII bacterium]|jgi:hypothetical protein|nr:Rpn family recombination-promoting nuclease/putative transposase [Clostridiales Family XIII bacterium]
MMKPIKRRKQMKVSFDKDFISALSDPAWSALFADVKVAGLAAESLTRAVVSKFGLGFGKVVRVTPQKYENIPGLKGSRVDVEAESGDNELAVYELQILYDRALPQRNLLAASHRISGSIPAGTDTSEYPVMMPRITVINICCYNIRDDCENADVIQPVQMRFGTPPHDVADDQYSVFYVQMPQFIAGEPDLADGFDCWMFTIWKSHELRKKPQEVVDMHLELKEFAARDGGFAQFCGRFDRIAADEGARKEYIMWLDESIRQRSIVDSAVEDAVAPLLEQLSEQAALIAELRAQLRKDK